jgi:hypothetical protein
MTGELKRGRLRLSQFAERAGSPIIVNSSAVRIIKLALTHRAISPAVMCEAKALAEAMPVQTPGSGSDGVTVSPSSANRCNC